MNSDKLLRKELINYLEGQHTHRSLRSAAGDLPEEFMNEKPKNIPYSFWQMLEHIRISQYDMVDFIRNENYQELEWPKDYWPPDDERATKELWEYSLNQYEKDLADLKNIINDPDIDLLKKIPHGTGQTIMKEVIQIIDHAGYHIGELILMRRAIGEWK